MKIAIVGTGISGLVAAHRLHREHEVVVYEAAPRIGGHTHTVAVETEAGTDWVDTGFIVFNDRNYPRFEALLAELGVPSQPSHMGFSVADGSGRFEFSGTPRGLFARRANLFDPRFLRMLRDWRRFNREAPALIGMNGTAPSLGHWLERQGFSRWFVERLIVPQASAVWSADPEQMWSFPASFLAEFFGNHGMYSLRGRPRWRTVAGGSRSYVEAIRGARASVDIAVPYFYPGRVFRRVLRHAAHRGVRVRLLLQGKVDYRIAALAARALYDELRGHGVRIFEYEAAFLHAKVAVVDDGWATVGSSNIDPLSLLLNLEANVIVDDAEFAHALRAHFEHALADSVEVRGEALRPGWRGWLQRASVAWAANIYLRVAGMTGRY